MTRKTQPENAHLGYSDTPILPDSGYHVHDGERPQPPVVTSGESTLPPSDATVLFDGTTLGLWESTKGGDAAWKVENGTMQVEPGTGNIRTRESFGDIQLHIEFASPVEVKGEGQGRGNSGVFMMGVYEIQVLDNYDNPTYADGTVGAIYGQYPPLVNPLRAPGKWNVYDILWKAPVFDGDTVTAPAAVTVLLNNVVLQWNQELLGKTDHKTAPAYVPHPAKGPVELQDHNDLVRFRNIWVRKIGE